MPLNNPQPSIDQNSVAITGGTISGVTLSTSVSQLVNLGGGLTITSTGAIQTTGVGTGSVVGNARGTGAVDLQTSRVNAAHVASGTSSAIVGGTSNSCSGAESVVGGSGCSSSGTRSAVFGFNNSAPGGYNLVAGANNIANAFASTCLGDRGTANRAAEIVLGSSVFGINGASQGSLMVLGGTTTNSTPVELLASVSSRITLQNDSTLAFSALISARRTDADNESAGYKIEGVIDRNTNAASTALVGSVVKTVLAEDTTAWDVNVAADTTNGALQFNVTGEVGKTIRWVAFVTVSEVVG